MVDVLVVADDASPCPFDPRLAQVSGIPQTSVVRHRRNRGIARSLNDGLRAAERASADWLLTVDQDSDLPSGYVDALSAGVARARQHGVQVGVIAPHEINDASGIVHYPTTNVGGEFTTAEVFQTGALWSVPALVEVGGFDETLGIDGVDAAACLELRRKGFHVVLEPSVTLDHRWGETVQVTLFGRQIAITNHSPERRTAMVNNRLRLAPKEFRQSPTQAFRSLRRLAVNTALAVSVEDDRWEKAKASGRGLWRATTR